MKRSSRWLVTVAVCLAIFAALAFFKFSQIQAMIAMGKAYPEHSETVSIIQTKAEKQTHSVSVVGELLAPNELMLRNEVEGRITGLNMPAGKQVAEGELLLQLDISEESAQLDAAKARVELTKLDLERAKRLIRQKTVSQESVDQAQASYTIAKADVATLKARISKKTLRAPFDAVVGLHDWEQGEYLGSNTPIVRLLGVTEYSWVDFNLPLSRGVLEMGESVAVKLQTGETLSAQVIAKDVVASASSRNVKYRAQLSVALPQAGNTTVTVKIPAGESELIVVPRTAMVFDLKGQFVYVLNADPAVENGYRAELRKVEVGQKTLESVSIVSGLEEGELVAAHGGFKLYPNVLTYIGERPNLQGPDNDNPSERDRTTAEEPHS